MKIGDIFTFLKKYPEATGSYKLALKNAKKLSKLDKQCQIHMKIGTSYKDLQEFDKAERSFQNAWQLADKNKFQEELAEVSSKLAGTLIEKNDIKGAKEYIKKAMEISLELGNQKLQMEARIMSGLATGF